MLTVPSLQILEKCPRWCSSSPPAKMYHGEQSSGFQCQPRVVQVVVGHYCVVAGFLNAKYRHHIASFRRFGKAFVFGVCGWPLCRPHTPEEKTIWVQKYPGYGVKSYIIYWEHH